MGLCMSRQRLESLEPGDYHVVVDAELADGSLTSGELTLEGARETEFLLSTYVCHPALANDNLSGIVVLWALARTLAHQRLEHTSRLWTRDAGSTTAGSRGTSRRSTGWRTGS